ELIHLILDLILSRADLLNLALTCSTLRDIIIPAHLDYRIIISAEYHTGLWIHLVHNPYYARNIRELTLFNR
ncbi:hypothetical protein K488DRAFT_21555, partial [Vararia minispora EC-137]